MSYDFKKLTARKNLLLKLRRFARDLPEGEPTRAAALEKVELAIACEKRGEHDRVNALVAELQAVVEKRLEAMP